MLCVIFSKLNIFFYKDEELLFRELESKQSFTEPPARYTEASLVKVLEEKGIGFEIEDSQFYDTQEKTLLALLLDYVLENKNHFR